MDKKNSEIKRKSRSSSEAPPDKKPRVDIENILLPTEDRNKDLSSHSIQNAIESLNPSKVELIECSIDPMSPKEKPTSSNENTNAAETNNNLILDENATNQISDDKSNEEIGNINDEDDQNCSDQADELPPTAHQSTSIEDAIGIRIPTVNTEDKLIECSILVDNGDKKIKWDDKKNSTSADVPDNSAKASQDPQTSTNAVPREKCAYGAKCFRKNSDHKEKFSHPGDADFNAKDDRPECRHGIHCYRKNPQHKKDYKHTSVRQKRKVSVNRVQMLQRAKDNDSDRDSDDSFEESVDESEYGPSEFDESSEDENDVDEDDSDW